MLRVAYSPVFNFIHLFYGYSFVSKAMETLPEAFLTNLIRLFCSRFKRFGAQSTANVSKRQRCRVSLISQRYSLPDRYFVCNGFKMAPVRSYWISRQYYFVHFIAEVT